MNPTLSFIMLGMIGPWQVILLFMPLLFLFTIVPLIFYLLTVQNTFKQISAENRKMEPTEVWLGIIPIFGYIWSFIIVSRLADSLKPEFEKRAGFAIMAAYCMADKKAANSVYEAFFPLIKRDANDDRLYVRKAVNWALRSIGKRNIDLNDRAIHMAHEIVALDSKSAKWIGKDAIRKLEADTVNILDYPRTIYRPL